MRKRDYFTTETVNNVTSLALVPDTCLSKAADDEPIFVLRAKDPVAPKLIEIWRILSTGITFEKTTSAQECADMMREWYIEWAQAELDK